MCFLQCFYLLWMLVIIFGVFWLIWTCCTPLIFNIPALCLGNKATYSSKQLGVSQGSHLWLPASWLSLSWLPTQARS